MNACLLVLAIAAGCVGTPDSDPTPDATSDPAPTVTDHWVAEDKLRHFALSFAATQMSYGGFRVAVAHDEAVIAAATTAFALGLAKEVHDARVGRPFSFKDIAWDAAGVALATLLVHQIN